MKDSLLIIIKFFDKPRLEFYGWSQNLRWTTNKDFNFD